MRIELAAGHAVGSVVCIHDDQNLIEVGYETVVVFIPQDHDRIASLPPRWRSVDRRHDRYQRKVPDVNQGGVQARLRAIGDGIKGALRAAVAASVLVVALIRGNEREVRYVTGSEVIIKAAPPFEADHVGQTVVRVMAFLHTLEVHEGIVFSGIQLEKGRSATESIGRGRDICEVAVTVSNPISSGRGQALLIALPAAVVFCQLISNHLANGAGGRKRTAVNVD